MVTPKRASEHMGKCDDKECKFSSKGTACCFGLRERVGCYMEHPEAVESQMRAISALTMQSQFARYRGDDEGAKLLEKIASKPFHFQFQGHEYTVSDSARNQSECPHCGAESPGYCWSKDDKAFIGQKKVGDEVCYCFECPKCFEKFFYHAAVN